MALERSRGFSGFRYVRMFEVEAVHGDALHCAVFVSIVVPLWTSWTSEIARHARS